MTFPAFKAGDSALSEPSGEFDSHTLPPLLQVHLKKLTALSRALIRGKGGGDDAQKSSTSRRIGTALRCCDEWSGERDATASASTAERQRFGAAAQFTAEQDQKRIMDLLHIAALRKGPSGDPNAADAANVDESKVPAYTLPDPLVLKSGSRVADAATWWRKRRPEIYSPARVRKFHELLGKKDLGATAFPPLETAWPGSKQSRLEKEAGRNP